jgi:hypothetical protein
MDGSSCLASLRSEALVYYYYNGDARYVSQSYGVSHSLSNDPQVEAGIVCQRR